MIFTFLSSRSRYGVLLLACLAFSGFTSLSHAQEAITSPESYFGFRMGSDRKIARWDRIVDYFSSRDTCDTCDTCDAR